MFVYAEEDEFNVPDCYKVIIHEGVYNKSQLMKALENAFNFPYFGHNWDSLLDLLSDFGWIKNSNISIYHVDVRNLNRDDLVNYIQVLDDAMQRLNDFPSPILYAIFRPSDRKMVESARQK